ncbi:MAG: translation initiation factor IF-2 [Bdellovibrionales bacterium]|nr:translation initiation factor IF-2 [Bdellovibrionales bacterium]
MTELKDNMENTTQQEPVKVYELAKELGIDSLSLLDKLGGLGIKVKNHMSELSEADLAAARAGLSTKSTSSAAKTVTKAASAKASGSKTTTKPAATPKAAVTKARRKAESSTDEAAPAKTEKAAPAASAAGSAVQKTAGVIRRRVRADGEVETIAPPNMLRQPQDSGMADESAVSESFESSELSLEQESFEASLGTGATAEGEMTLQGGETQEAATVSETEPSAKKSVPVFPQRPVAPRRSILKIAEVTAPPPRPMIKPASPAPGGITPRGEGSARPGPAVDKDGFRVIRMTKENLDQMAEEEAAKKRGGGGREVNIRPEDVRFADYRKKEMVFLPKKKKLPLGKSTKSTQVTQMKAQKRVVEMGELISIQDFAAQLGVKAVEVIRKLMGMGQMATMNQSIDFDTATLLASEYQYEVRDIAFKEADLIEAAVDSAESVKLRPPVVTIMGHVDHGKTSLLDAIRSANVAAKEAGGITQHIGAYTVEQDGKLITFIDTPGHEAFTSMRARGANVTDIVILVVAADDGVMPQTREALSHAKAAGVPIIVAVNKIDKPGANPERVKQALAELDLLAEDWGGQTMFIPVSAIKRTNLDKLLEGILLQAEVLDLKANPEARASGVVLEARLEKGRGAVVSLLVKRGTLRVGDSIVAGPYAGRVKAMMDHLGQQIEVVAPGMAAEILGLEGVPNAGEAFDCTKTESDARLIAENRLQQIKAKQALASSAAGKMSLEDLFSKVQAGGVKELPVVLKADVFGSLEAVRESLQKTSTDKVKVKVIFAGAGGISESDVLLASASNAIILGFNVRPETKARQLAEAEHIEVMCYNIIYELLDDVKKAMVGLLDKKKVEKFLGRAEVRQTFTVPKVGMIAGSAVIDGKILRGANVRLLRDSRVIYEGKMSSLKRFKDDAKEVAQGYECGIGLENYNDLKPGDLIEAYQIDLITPELS